ncbi:hypothetical protein PROFUN_11832 [Planoprotostelium fungivorum]|uniref:ER-bound oxygenase mpaB/mpaB'/Rubber oxygenase catalytic domain-containing protein n=1 Tax=Planoprotostelium fungivorum TaxID=1890364 RepID=A0A2P6N9A3_9EUKA|nr:hypothetical protein PROFUN_11832 [Planoprotostelium fungivorum]
MSSLIVCGHLVVEMYSDSCVKDRTLQQTLLMKYNGCAVRLSRKFKKFFIDFNARTQTGPLRTFHLGCRDKLSRANQVKHLICFTFEGKWPRALLLGIFIHWITCSYSDETAPVRMKREIRISPAFHAGALPPSLSCHAFEFDRPTLDPQVCVVCHLHLLTIEDCVTGNQLEPLRLKSDDLADNCIREMKMHGHFQSGDDSLNALYQASQDPRCLHSRQFLQEASSDPPFVIDRDALKRGQQVFWDNTLPICNALLNASLAGGFASSRITPTLKSTGRLMTDSITLEPQSEMSRDRTYRRVLETTVWVTDVMRDDDFTSKVNTWEERRKSVGWQSTTRVRLLHAQVRNRLEKVKMESVPINQEDMLGTLAGFCIVPMWTLKRMRLSPKNTELDDFIHLWQYLGYYLGCSSDLLLHHFSSWKKAESFMSSIAIHILDPLSSPRLSFDLLMSMSDRPPRHESFHHLVAVSRYMLNDPICDAFKLPKTNWKSWFTSRMQVNALRWSHVLGHVMPGLRQEQAIFMKKFIPLSVEARLGEDRRKMFSMRDDIKHGWKVNTNVHMDEEMIKLRKSIAFKHLIGTLTVLACLVATLVLLFHLCLLI